MGSARSEDSLRGPVEYVVVEHVGQQDKPITVGIIGTSEDGMQSLCGPTYVRCSFVVLPRREFAEVLSYVRTKVNPGAGDRRKWPKGYAPFYGTFEVRWKEAGAETRSLVPSELACSYFSEFARLSAGQSSSSLKKYLVTVRGRIGCVEESK